MLFRSGDAWLVMDGSSTLPADAGRIKSFLDTLASITSVERVASSEGARAALGMDGAESMRIELKDFSAKRLACFVLGDYTEDASRVYAGPPDGLDAWSLPASVASYARASRNSWLDLRVFPGDYGSLDVEELRLSGTVDLGADTDRKSVV